MEPKFQRGRASDRQAFVPSRASLTPKPVPKYSRTSGWSGILSEKQQRLEPVLTRQRVLGDELSIFQIFSSDASIEHLKFQTAGETIVALVCSIPDILA
jgi:hypothetical protein